MLRNFDMILFFIPEILYHIHESKSLTEVSTIINTKKGVVLTTKFYQRLMIDLIDNKYLQVMPIVVWKLLESGETCLDQCLYYAFQNKANCEDAFYLLLMFSEILKENLQFVQFASADDATHQYDNDIVINGNIWRINDLDSKNLRFVVFMS